MTTSTHQKISLFFGLVGVVGMLPACHPTHSSQVDSAERESRAFPQAAQERWNEYMATVPVNRLQRDCVPRRLSPPKGVPEKGVVLAYHGFSACPQQFFEVAQRFAAEGYHVLLPLSPGHGRKFSADNKDDVSDLPTRDDWRKYVYFTQQMNAIMHSAAGEKVVFGLSLGGTLAAYTSATAGFYNRQAIMVPMFELGLSKENPTEREVGNWLLRTVSVFPHIGAKNQSWGDACRTVEREKGRAGFCDFQVTHAMGAALFGKEAEAATRRLPPEKRIMTQFVGVDKDPAINNTTFANVIRDYSRNFGKFRACFYPVPANHSLFSRYDAPSENKFWLNSVLQDATAFVTHAKFFPEDSSKNVDGFGLNHCALTP